MSQYQHIIIAPDSFKESMTALEVAETIEYSLRKVFNESLIEIIPVGDGGEGTMKSLSDAMGGVINQYSVHNPIGQLTNASMSIVSSRKTAIIEMAEASGLERITISDRNPLLTSTYGTGELIKYALNEKVEKILLCIGGSATNDAGVGMLKALGAQFLNQDGEEIAEGGAALRELSKIDLDHFDKRLLDVEIIVACDVNNPLTGTNGATFIYGPQKGATSEGLEILESALTHFHHVVERQFNCDNHKVAGSGAAGGLGYALMTFMNATLETGVDMVLRETQFLERVQKADLVITGEGRIDSQTINGKTPIGVAQVAKKYGIEVIAICGLIGPGYELVYKHGIDKVYSLANSQEEANETIKNSKFYLERLSYKVANLLLNK